MPITDNTAALIHELGDYILFHKARKSGKGVYRVSFRDRVKNYTSESQVSYAKALELAVEAMRKLKNSHGGGCDDGDDKEKHNDTPAENL